MRAITALRLMGCRLPFPYLPCVKQVTEYKAAEAPILNPLIPRFTVTMGGVLIIYITSNTAKNRV